MTITLTRDAFNAIMRTCKDVAKGSHYVGLNRDTLRLICRDWQTGVVITAPHAKACVLPVRREDNF